MPLVPIDLRKCPHCGEAVEIRIAGVCSGLGPSRRVCRCCEQVVPSDRREWPMMNASERGRFLLTSLAYIFVAGAVGGGIV